MRVWQSKSLAPGLFALFAALPAHANRMTFEVWPDSSPDHAVSCSVSLSNGWISLVHVAGAGMPTPQPLRWRASQDEIEALSHGLQAFVGGQLISVNTYTARTPPAPFLAVSWVTRLDGSLLTGLYIQRGLTLPRPLSQTLAVMGLNQPCGLTAKAGE